MTDFPWRALTCALALVLAPVALAQQPAATPAAATPAVAPAPTATPPAATPAAATPASAATPAAAEPSPEELAAKAQAFYDSLHRQTGPVQVVGGKVSLNIPETHYFIGPEDSRRVIVDVWGNPPDSAEGVEGMIFPKDANPMADTWGAVVTYSDEGHVKDDDAAKIDYAKLLRDMQKDTRDANEERRKAGYNAVELVGWAEPPHYDRTTRKLYWAKTLQFEGAHEQTLNYDIRVLGRDGVLVISFVSGMNQLADIKAAAPGVLAMPSFSQGAQYTDYREGVDKKAAYGIAGLIAGGAAVALAKKAGLIGLIILYGKKFIILIVAGFAAIGNFFRRMFGGKPKDKQ